MGQINYNIGSVFKKGGGMFYPTTPIGRFVNFLVEVASVFLGAVFMFWMGKSIFCILMWFVFKQTILGFVVAILATIGILVWIIFKYSKITDFTVDYVCYKILFLDRVFIKDVFLRGLIWECLFISLLACSVIFLSNLATFLVKL